MASTSRSAAGRILLSATAHIGCRSGCCTVATSSRTPVQVLEAACRVSNAYSQRTIWRRPFASAAQLRSAWPLGRDAAPTSSTTSEAVSNGQRPSLPPGERAITLQDLMLMKEKGEPIAMLTAYDYPSALGLRSAPVDICLVGDSLTNVALGHRTTHPLTLQAIIHHVQAVVRGIRHPMLNQHGMPPVPLLIADVPMGYGEISVEEGMRAAVALIKEGGADGVKIEGGLEVVDLVDRLSSFGIPVIAHIGLQPQRSSSGSALNLAGRTAEEAIDLMQTADAMQEAGACALLLECIPARVGDAITKRVRIPTIGIGAGAGTDGQVLVTDDILGECNSPLFVLAGLEQGTGSEGSKGAVSLVDLPRPAPNTPGLPRFVRNFVAPFTAGSSVGAIRMGAVQAYVKAVKERSFPSDAEGYKIKREELATFKEYLAEYDSNRQDLKEQDESAIAF